MRRLLSVLLVLVWDVVSLDRAHREGPTLFSTPTGHGLAGMPRKSLELPVRLDPDSNPKKTAALYQLSNELQERFTRSFQSAVEHGNSGDYAAAIEQYQVVNRIFPGYIESHTNLAVCLERTGRDAEAENVLTQAVRLFPGEYLPADNLCTLKIKSLHDRMTDAMPTCLLALRNAKGQSEAEAPLHLKLASLLTEATDYELSHEHFRAAQQLQPHSSDVLHNFACSLTRAAQYKLASETAALGMKLHPEDVRHRLNAGSALLYSRRHDSTAVSILYSALELFVSQQPADSSCSGGLYKTVAPGQRTMGQLVRGGLVGEQYQCGRGGAYPCNQHAPLVFSEPEVRVALLRDKQIEGEGGLVSDGCHVYSLHHNHSDNLADHLIRMQRVRNEPLLARSGLKVHQLHAMPVLSLIQHELRNHYHWLLEALVRLVVALDHLGAAGVHQLQILVPWEAGINGLMRQSLELVLTEEQLASCQFYHHGALTGTQRVVYDVKQLYMVHWSRPAGIHPQEVDAWSVYHPPRHGMLSMRSRVLELVSEQQGLPERSSSVLYVSRALAVFRKVRGEPLLIEALRKLVGHQNLQVHYGNESFVEQVRMFHRAQLVIGAHGSGLANTVFCRPGAVVLQFPLLPNLLSSSIAHIAAAVGLHFWTAPQLGAHQFEDYYVNQSNLAPLMELTHWARHNNHTQASRGCPGGAPKSEA